MSTQPFKGGEISNQQAEAIDALASEDEFKGKSRLTTLMQLPWGRKWGYFRDQLLVRTVVVTAIVCVVVYIMVQVLSPVAPPKLYVAVFDDVISQQEASSLQSEVAEKLNLPEGRKGGVLIDSSFTSDETGVSKLQTLLSSNEVDVIIAAPKTYKKLAGFGYLTNLNSSLTASQRTSLSDAFVMLKGFNDSSESDNPDYDGSGKGKTEPFGITMTGFRRWDDLKSVQDDAIIGIAQDAPNRAEAQKFISFLKG